jgi:hypothetical protein
VAASVDATAGSGTAAMHTHLCVRQVVCSMSEHVGCIGDGGQLSSNARHEQETRGASVFACTPSSASGLNSLLLRTTTTMLWQV